jgi:NAD-dependent deacetylase
MASVPSGLERARAMLREAKRIAVLTGAGISAESGIPTFRGAGGLWKHFRAEDLATPEAFRRDPRLCWEWYDWRRSIIAGVKPNAGHYALVELERRGGAFTLITQNVDGLHTAAGSKSILEVHGSIWKLRCTECAKEWSDRSVPLALPPRCAECGGLARPGVVWFGENLDPAIWAAAERAVSGCDVLLVVGTSALVYPAAGLAPLARSRDSKIIEVNLEPTPVSEFVDIAFTGPAGEILPQLVG